MAVHPFSAGVRTPDSPRTPQVAERVWTVTNGARWLSCELRDYADAGCDAQLLRDGAFYDARCLASRAAALDYVDAVRARLERQGWTLVAGFLSRPER
jgi:hypothetical protein